jgi:hypothetical protein
LSFTTPLLHEASAPLIAAAVAPGLNVAQTVDRSGMPPGTPAWDQSIRREAGNGSAASAGDVSKTAAATAQLEASNLNLTRRFSVAIETLPCSRMHQCHRTTTFVGGLSEPTGAGAGAGGAPLTRGWG